jgi:hypothetical protein
LKILGFDNQERQDKLNVLTSVRNCLYSNGIHSNENDTFVIDGNIFKFVKGESFENANWVDIHYMANSAFEVLGEILESYKVIQLPHPLVDEYIFDK